MRRLLLVFALVVATVGVVLGVSINAGLDRLWPLSWLAWAPVGYVILTKRRGNRVGVAALFVGVSWGLVFISDWVVARLSSSSVASWLDLVTEVGNPVPWLAIFWLLLVFPSGDYPARFERVLGWGILGYGSLSVLAFLVSPVAMSESGRASPLAVSDPGPLLRFVAGDGGFLPVIVFFLTTLVLLVLRWRRSTGVERVQYRWLFLGASLFVLVLAIGNVLPESSPGQAVFVIAGWSIPVCIGVAVVRYRLYDIDRVISRTMSYGVVVILLGLVFATGVIWMPQVLGFDESPLVVASTTLVIAALFNPLRKRVQVLVDRRFNRSRFDAERVMTEFSQSLRERVGTDVVMTGWVGVVSQTMQPSSIGVWTNLSDQDKPANPP